MIEFIDKDKYFNSTGIYCITNVITGKKYIGQTYESFKRRFWHHRWCLANNKHHSKMMQADWNKYGADSFTFSVLEVIQGRDISLYDEKEIAYIKKAMDEHLCYNLVEGGHYSSTVGILPPEHYKRLGEMNRQRMLGSKLPQSTIDKMRNGQRKGSNSSQAKLTEEDVLNIRQRIRNGERPKDIYTDYNITYGNFKMIRANKTWTHVQLPEE